MLKKSLIAIAVLAIAMPAMAGSLKIHTWTITTTVTPEHVCTIDVLIDVGYYLTVVNQNPVKLTQADGTNNYSGHFLSNVLSNFNATLSAKITAAQDITIKTLKAEFQNGSQAILAGVTNAVDILITANGVNIETLTAGDSDVKIADMEILAVPA
jgi:hypothetical protein